MSQEVTKSKEDSESALALRPFGLSFSFIAFAVAGAYYLVYPLFQDTGLYPLYVIGGLSLVGSLGLMSMKRWGLWLGLALYPAQIVAPTFALMSTIGGPRLLSDYIALAFIASLVALIFLATLSFLFILDKRKSFK